MFILKVSALFTILLVSEKRHGPKRPGNVRHEIYYMIWGLTLNFPLRCSNMEEVLCNIEITKDNNTFVAKIQSDIGGMREYKSSNFEEVLEQMTMDLQEEFELA